MRILKNVSDKELINRLRKLVEKEKKLTLEILPFLAEVDRRGLFLGWGYSSLTDYCISHLGYCESSAWRRVRAARVVKDFPEVYDKLAQGRLTFSAVVLASKVLKQENKIELLARLCGKSQGQIKRIIAEYEQPQIIPDVARPRLVVKVVQSALTSRAAGLSDKQSTSETTPEEVGEIPLRSEGKKFTSDVKSTPLYSEFEKMFEIRFAADEELMELMTWMKSYLSGRFPKGTSFLEIFKYAMRYVREREDLARRAERRDKNGKKSATKPHNTGADKTDSKSRYIPQQVRERVWARDGGRCVFVGSNGKRCNSNFNLQFDHYPVPFARGGPSRVDNLRLLCARHNKFTAQQVYGKKHMELFKSRRE